MDTVEVRKILGLTQDQMRKICNTSIGTITKWDQKQREPRGQAIRLLEVMVEAHQNGDFDKYFGKYLK
ncbi:MAG: hypothetical protein MI862_26085 [Desulfobacterales bacterium]|nr:hypothetical protein [Desulfobacterales bacterium]